MIKVRDKGSGSSSRRIEMKDNGILVGLGLAIWEHNWESAFTIYILKFKSLIKKV